MKMSTNACQTIQNVYQGRNRPLKIQTSSSVEICAGRKLKCLPHASKTVEKRNVYQNSNIQLAEYLMSTSIETVL